MSSEGFAGSMLHDSFGNLGPAPPLPSVTLFRLSHCNPACQGQGLGPGEGQGGAGSGREDQAETCSRAGNGVAGSSIPSEMDPEPQVQITPQSSQGDGKEFAPVSGTGLTRRVLQECGNSEGSVLAPGQGRVFSLDQDPQAPVPPLPPPVLTTPVLLSLGLSFPN